MQVLEVAEPVPGDVAVVKRVRRHVDSPLLFPPGRMMQNSDSGLGQARWTTWSDGHVTMMIRPLRFVQYGLWGQRGTDHNLHYGIRGLSPIPVCPRFPLSRQRLHHEICQC